MGAKLPRGAVRRGNLKAGAAYLPSTEFPAGFAAVEAYQFNGFRAIVGDVRRGDAIVAVAGVDVETEVDETGDQFLVLGEGGCVHEGIAFAGDDLRVGLLADEIVEYFTFARNGGKKERGCAKSVALINGGARGNHFADCFFVSESRGNVKVVFGFNSNGLEL